MRLKALLPKTTEGRYLAVAVFFLFLLAVMTFIIWKHPEVAGLQPESEQQTYWLIASGCIMGCAFLALLLLLVAVRSAGRKEFDDLVDGTNGDDEKKKRENDKIAAHPAVAMCESIGRHLHSRFGLFWYGKVRLLLVTGNEEAIEQLVQTQLAASLSPFPPTLTPEQLDTLRQQAPLPQDFIAQTQQQLTRLDKLPPDWNIAWRRQLLEQTQALWPEQAKPLVQQWQQQLSAASISTERLNGWHQGMTILQQLSDRLRALDEQKGKYMTVSELKSVVFSAMQSFNQAVPTEELLRKDQPLSSAADAQIEMQLKQLTVRYSEIKNKSTR